MFEHEAAAGQKCSGDGWFETTHWTVVLAAKGANSEAASAALNRLCEAYWLPLYTFVRRSGHNVEEAKDLTQGFFARLLEKDYLKGLQPDRGKFRTFILVALKRYLANEWDRANRQKRGGGMQVISLNETGMEAACEAGLADVRTPEHAFDQKWAGALLQRVIRQLAAEACATGRGDLFESLRGFLTGEQDQSVYPEVAQTLRMSEGTLRVNIHRLRRRYRELLRFEVAQTVENPEEIDSEIRHLFGTAQPESPCV